MIGKITSNKTKHVLVENEFKKLQKFGPSLFIGQLNNDGAQNYLIFQPLYYILKRLGDTGKNCIMEIYRFVRQKIY